MPVAYYIAEDLEHWDQWIMFQVEAALIWFKIWH